MREASLLFAAVWAVGCSCGLCEPSRNDQGGCTPVLSDPDRSGFGGFGAFGGFGGNGAFGGSFGGSGGSASDASPCTPEAGVDHVEGPDGGCVPAGCVVGRGDCNSDLVSDGCETDLANESSHCGACGSICAELACEYGSCFEPEIVVSLAKPDITALALAADGLYFATSGDFSNLEFASASGWFAIVSPLSFFTVRHIEVHGTLVLGGNDHHVLVCDSAQNCTPKFPSLSGPARWTSDGTQLYFATEVAGSPSWDAAGFDADAPDAHDAADAPEDAPEDASPSLVRLQRVAFYQAAPETLWEVAGRLGAIAKGGDVLYLAVGAPGRLFAVPLLGSPPTLLASGSFDLTRLAVDGAFLYALDAVGPQVIRVPVAGGPAALVATLPRAGFDLRVDSGSVWVALTAPAELWRYDAKGATLLAGALVPNTEIAVDAAHAYWISPGVGVLRVPR